MCIILLSGHKARINGKGKQTMTPINPKTVAHLLEDVGIIPANTQRKPMVGGFPTQPDAVIVCRCFTIHVWRSPVSQAVFMTHDNGEVTGMFHVKQLTTLAAMVSKVVEVEHKLMDAVRAKVKEAKARQPAFLSGGPVKVPAYRRSAEPARFVEAEPEAPAQSIEEMFTKLNDAIEKGEV
jgi:hypothetical protein